ncbi:unnamed protein product [Adineta ricciae]|uniref:TLDc domain-containing protein n=1 Tax=Adineta ricciae TaxID=249248 RepID=A0A816D2U4_ADIRI|nr:unnamed protein product [Adineta ricciae]
MTLLLVLQVGNSSIGKFHSFQRISLHWSLYVNLRPFHRGSTHGLNASAFHKQCDNEGETYTVVSTTNGYLFGGYVDVNWTTSLNHVPAYSSSTKAFLFSLLNVMKIPAKKFSIDKRYRNYAVVNDVSSGPIFGDMNQPDVGIYEINGHFRCQIHFPSVYMGGVGVSSFPPSNDCIINEMEVFIPVWKPSFVYIIRNVIISLAITFSGWFAFTAMLGNYRRNNVQEGRVCGFVCLFLAWVNYLYGCFVLLEAFMLILTIIDWKYPERYDLRSIRSEKRFVSVCIVVLIAGIII